MAVDWGQIFSKPENQSALIQSGAGLLGGMISGNAASGREAQNQRQSDKDIARSRQFGLLDQARAQENGDFAARQSQQDDADQTVLGAMGPSPLAFQKDRMQMDLIQQALAQGGPSNLSAHMAPFARGIQTGFGPSADAEAPYWAAVAQAGKGRFNGANLGGIYGTEAGAGADMRMAQINAGAANDFASNWRDHGAAIGDLQRTSMGMASGDYDAAVKAEQEDDDDGGGFWGGLGGILKVAAPIAAMAIPGVGPLLGAGIMAAGQGVGNKLQGGSWGDSLKQGALAGALGYGASKIPGVDLFRGEKAGPTVVQNLAGKGGGFEGIDLKGLTLGTLKPGPRNPLQAAPVPPMAGSPFPEAQTGVQAALQQALRGRPNPTGAGAGAQGYTSLLDAAKGVGNFDPQAPKKPGDPYPLSTGAGLRPSLMGGR